MSFAKGLTQGFRLIDDYETRQRQLEMQERNQERLDEAHSRQKVVWGRQDQEWDYQQEQRQYAEAARLWGQLAYNPDGTRRNFEEMSADPAVQRAFSTSPVLKSMLQGRPGVGGADVRIAGGFKDPNSGRMGVMLEHRDPETGEVISQGPATENGSREGDDPVVLMPEGQWHQVVEAQLAGKVEAFGEKLQALKRQRAQRAGLRTAMSGPSGEAPTPAPSAQPQGGLRVASAPAEQPVAQEPVPDAELAQVSGRGTEPAPAPQAEQAGPTRLAAVRAELEELEREWPKHLRHQSTPEGREKTARYNALMQELDELEGPYTPRDLGEDVRGAIKGGARTLSDSYSQFANTVADYTYRPWLEVGKGLLGIEEGEQPPQQAATQSAPATEPQGQAPVSEETQQKVSQTKPPQSQAEVQEVAQQVQRTVQTKRPGARWTDEEKEKLIQWHLADPQGMPLETLDRVIRTGRLSKRDLKVVGDSIVDITDGAPQTVYTAPQTLDPKDLVDLQAAQVRLANAVREGRGKEQDQWHDMVKLYAGRYGDGADAEVSRILQMTHGTPFLRENGVDLTNPSHTAAVFGAYEDLKAAEEASDGLFSSRKEYSSLTPFLAARLHGVKPEAAGQLHEYAAKQLGNNLVAADKAVLLASRLHAEHQVPIEQAIQEAVRELGGGAK